MFSVESTVDPIEAELGGQEIKDELSPERQARQWPVPVIEKLHETVGRIDAEQIDCKEDTEAYAAVTLQKRHDEPIADVGDEPALFPPGSALVTRGEPGQQRKTGAHGEQIGQRPPKRVRDAIDHGKD